MAFDPITITGKPRPAPDPRVGSGYELPLDREPPETWQKYWEGFNWPAATHLTAAHNPRIVAGTCIALPDVRGEDAYRQLLSAIDMAMDEINHLVGEEEAKREAAEAVQHQSDEDKRAEDAVIFDKLWAEREDKRQRQPGS
jgi:hypothetical protein